MRGREREQQQQHPFFFALRERRRRRGERSEFLFHPFFRQQLQRAEQRPSFFLIPRAKLPHPFLFLKNTVIKSIHSSSKRKRKRFLVSRGQVEVGVFFQFSLALSVFSLYLSIFSLSSCCSPALQLSFSFFATVEKRVILLLRLPRKSESDSTFTRAQRKKKKKEKKKWK